jgi:sensor histidine kinase regulating citrate/malate metabolism
MTTITIFGVTTSVNSLVTTLLLLCIFFTFFSVTIELGGALSPQTVASNNLSCNETATDQSQTVAFKPGVRNFVTAAEGRFAGNAGA